MTLVEDFSLLCYFEMISLLEKNSLPVGRKAGINYKSIKIISL